MYHCNNSSQDIKTFQVKNAVNSIKTKRPFCRMLLSDDKMEYEIE
jgi:hypothetical protein